MMRRRLLEIPLSGDLYPIGTDIVKKYVYDAGYSFTYDTYLSATTGEVISGSYATEEIYIPIDPTYTYEKNGYRLSRACWYDSDKTYISDTAQNNTSVQVITNIPQNARFLRFATVKGISATQYAITRIA